MIPGTVRIRHIYANAIFSMRPFILRYKEVYCSGFCNTPVHRQGFIYFRGIQFFLKMYIHAVGDLYLAKRKVTRTV